MPLNLAVAWLLQQSGGTLFNLAQQYLSDRMGFGSLTKSHVRSLLEEYIQKLEAKIDEDRISMLHGALSQFQDALKTNVAKREFLIQALNNFQMLANLPEQGMTGGYRNAQLSCLAYLGMAASFIALGDEPKLIAEKMIAAVYADSNTAKEALGENVVRQILAQFPKPPPGPLQQPKPTAFSPSPNTVSSQSSLPTNSPMGTVLLTCIGHRGKVNSVVWSPDGKRIASASADKTVQVWDTLTGKSLLMYRGHHNVVHSVTWSPDGKRIASASADKTVQVWDAMTGKLILTYQGHTNIVYNVIWSPDGKYIVSNSNDKTVQVWDATTCQTLLNSRHYPDLKNAIALRAWSPDSKYIVSVGRSVKIWEPATGKVVLTYKQYNTETAHWSPDGKCIASGGHDKIVQIWDSTVKKSLLTYRGHTNVVSGVDWSPDGRRIASASTDKTVQVWDALTGQRPLIHRPVGVTYVSSSIKWSPSSDRIALGGFDVWGKGRVVIIKM